MTEPAPETAEAKTILRVVDVVTTAFHFPQEDGSTLTVTREGTEVPAGSVKQLIETADRQGVRLQEVSEK